MSSDFFLKNYLLLLDPEDLNKFKRKNGLMHFLHLPFKNILQKIALQKTIFMAYRQQTVLGKALKNPLNL